MKRLYLAAALVANSGAVTWTASSFFDTQKSITLQQNKIDAIENDSVFTALKNETQSLRMVQNDNDDVTLYRMTESGEKTMTHTDEDYFVSLSAMEKLQIMQQEAQEKTAPHNAEIDTLKQKNALPKAGLVLSCFIQGVLLINFARTFSRNQFRHHMRHG